MLNYFARRLLTMVITLVVISALVFIIIQLPPGDYLTTQIAELESQGEMVDREKIEHLRQQYPTKDHVVDFGRPGAFDELITRRLGLDELPQRGQDLQAR